MPVLTIRMTEEEMTATEQAAQRQRMSKSEFARRAITAAADAERKTASLRGALKGKYTYKQAMKFIRG
jgi:hypothetical protein